MRARRMSRVRTGPKKLVVRGPRDVRLRHRGVDPRLAARRVSRSARLIRSRLLQRRLPRRARDRPARNAAPTPSPGARTPGPATTASGSRTAEPPRTRAPLGRASTSAPPGSTPIQCRPGSATRAPVSAPSRDPGAAMPVSSAQPPPPTMGNYPFPQSYAPGARLKRHPRLERIINDCNTLRIYGRELDNDRPGRGSPRPARRSSQTSTSHSDDSGTPQGCPQQR